MAANRIGKALKHGTKVATPTGWVRIEDICIGDSVIAGDGSITKVLGVYPQGEVQLYSLSFDGMNSIETCAEHLWKYQHPRARYPYRRSHGKTEANPFYGEWVIGNTAELMQFGKISRTRAVIPMTKPFKFTGKTLPLKPYLLGLLLGDGSLSRDSIKFSSADDELVNAFNGVFKTVKYQGYDYGINGAMQTIKKLGLHGTVSNSKFIPDDYLYSNEDDRLELLRGLMDTDGSIYGISRAAEFTTCSDALANNFEWLATSLGMKCRRELRHTKAQNGNGQPSWRIHLRSGNTCPFKLKRKADKWKALKETSDWLLHGVDEVGKGYATCIEVEHESHTFVIEHGIVTHNTEGAGGYETALHLTGLYPDWWQGAMFDAPVNFWAAGKTNETTRDIVQAKLFGKVRGSGPTKRVEGTGLIPGECIGDISWKQGVSDLIDKVEINHKSGGSSVLALKSYQQGRGAFEGTEQDGIWLDEEPPMEIYGECLIRTATTEGLIYMTFTPLDGMTDTVMQFIPTDMKLK